MKDLYEFYRKIEGYEVKQSLLKIVEPFEEVKRLIKSPIEQIDRMVEHGYITPEQGLQYANRLDGIISNSLNEIDELIKEF